MTRQALAAAVTAMLAVGVAQAREAALVSDLSITMNDFVPTYTAGGLLTYTIGAMKAQQAEIETLKAKLAPSVRD